ncbi:hypothetical protein [Bifidobacterium lemurum]|uniref:hypothetical protein n=1 Tax=Bifidobacterium lemurum TaxID=1603886 RepID=UPI001867640B|nr:hypothetical protein [Bifidobacterium lemurum]QOL34378.1 hypothetical protein BL8807_00020 [Bifidobacterium lemurum]
MRRAPRGRRPCAWPDWRISRGFRAPATPVWTGFCPSRRQLADGKRFLIADDDADRLELVRALRAKDLADVTGMQLRDAYECAKVVRSGTFSRWLADMDDDEAREIWREYVLNARWTTRS